MSKAPTGAQLWDNSTHIAKTQNSVPATQTGRAQSAAKIQVTVIDNVYVRTSPPEALEAVLKRLHDPKGEDATKAAALITKACTVEGISKDKQLYQAVQLLKDVGQFEQAQALEAVTKTKICFGWRNGRLAYGYVNPSDTLDKAKGLFKMSLQSAIFSGIIPAGRNKKAGTVVGHTGLICLDFDKIPAAHLQTAKFILAFAPGCVLTFISPSGNGIKCVVWVDFDFSVVTDWSNDDYHKTVYEQVKRQYESILSSQGIKADISCDNINRHCFLPYRPNASLNTAADPLEINSKEVYAIVKGYEEKREREKAETAKRRAAFQEKGLGVDVDFALSEARRLTDQYSKAAPYGENGNPRHAYVKDFIRYALRFGVDRFYVYQYCINAFDDIADRFDSLLNWFYTNCEDQIGVDEYKLLPDTPTEADELHTITGKLSNNKSVSDSLISFTELADRSQLKAPTGIGKTFFVFNVLLPYLERKKKLLIFAVPYQAQGDQAQKDYTYKGQILPYIKEGSTAAHFAAVKDSPAVIVTYNSLYKLKEFYKGSTLVIDESHHLLNDASRGFNFESCNDVFEAFDQVEKVICISGTPHDFMKDFGFKFFEVKQTDTTPIHLHRRSYTGKLFDNIFAHLEGLKYRKSAGLHCVLWDKIEKLIQLRDALVSMGVLRAEQIAILDSHRKQDDDYQSIKNTGRLPEKIRLVLTTRLIGDGVNIYDKPGDIILGDVRNKELFVQFPARFRKAKKVNVFSYREDKEHKLYIPSIKALRAAHESADKRLNEVLIYGQGAATKSHTKHIGHLKHDDFEKVYFSRDGVYKISEPLIYFNEIRRRDYQTGTDEFYQAICTEFPHFVMADQAAVEAAENETLQASQKATKRKKKDAEKHIIRKLIHDPETVLCAVADVCDFHTKRSISAMPAAAEPATRAEVVKFKTENLETLEQKPFAPVKRFVKLRSLGFDNTSAAAIVSRFNKGELSLFHDRLVYNTWAFFHDVAPHLLMADEQAKAVHYKKLYAALDPVIGAALTGDELAAAMQRFCPPGLTSNKAVTMAKRLYEVKEDRTAKGRKYILTERTDLTKVLQPFGLTVGEFLAKNRLNVEKTASAKNRNPLKISAVTKLKHIEKNSVTQLTIDLGEKYTAWWASPGATWNN